MSPHKISILVILHRTACIVLIQSAAVDVAMVTVKQYIIISSIAKVRGRDINYAEDIDYLENIHNQ